MADYNIKAEITADSTGYESGVKKAIKASKSLSTTLATVGLALNGITAAFNIVGKAVSVVSKTVSQCTSAFKVQINAEKALDTAIKNSPLMNGESSNNLKKFASTMQSITNYGDEQLLPLITQLTAAGRSEEEITKIIKTATDIAASGAMSLDTAVTQLNATLNGNVGKLGQQNAELKNLTKEELENGKAVDILAQKYKGMAQAVSDPTVQLKNLVGDLKETIGSKLMPTVQMFASEAIKNVQKIISVIDQINLNKVTAVFKVIVDNVKSMATSGLEKLMGLFSNMKDVFSSLADSDGFKKAVKIVNTIIDAYAYLYSQIAGIFNELGNAVKTFAENVWSIIKKLFESSNTALEDSSSNVKTWGDSFYNIFNNMFKGFQDVVQSITHILKGDWSVAWEYMKLACARVADSILDILSDLVNAFPKMIEKITDFMNNLIEQANKVRRKLKLDEWDLLSPPGKADFSKGAGVDQYIKDTEKKIESLTGKPADKNLKDLDKFTAKAGEKLGKFTASFSAKVKKAEEEIAGMGKHFVEGVSSATESGGGAGEKNLGQIFDELIEKIKNIPAAIKSINIKDLITRDFETIKDSVINFIPNMQERFKASIERIRNLTPKQIKYAFNEGLKNAKKLLDKFVPYLTKWGKSIIAVFQSIQKGMGNVFSAIKIGLNKAFDFDVDSAIEKILMYEDKILTFFTETLPKLPAFIQSALQSIQVMFQTLENSIDASLISNIIQQMVKSLVATLPNILTSLGSVISEIINGILTGINASLPSLNDLAEQIGGIFASFAQKIQEQAPLFDEVINGIADLLSNFITGIVDSGLIDDLADIASQIVTSLVNGLDKMLPAISKALGAIIPAIGKFLTESAPAVINLLFDFIGVISENLPKLVQEIIKALPTIINSIIENIPKFFKEDLPTLISEFIKIIPDIVKAGVDITVALIRHLPEIVASFIVGLVKSFAQVDWWQTIKDIFQAFIDGFKKLFGINSPSTVFKEFGTNIWEGLKEGLKGIGDWFYNLFTNAKSRIIEAFSGIGNWFRSLWDGIIATLKAPFNFFIRGINTVINAMNKISVKIPKWVPGIGGNTFGISIPTIKELAVGTQNAMKGLTLVGEAGPELVRFNGGEQVLNNRNTNKALQEMNGNKSNVFNVTFNNTMDTTAYAMMSQLRQYQRQLAFNGVL